MNDTLGMRLAKRGTIEDPGTIRQRMRCVDLADFGCQPERFRRDAEKLGRVAQVEPWLDSIRLRPVGGNPVMRSQRRHPLAGPTIAMAGGQPVPVEDAGDQIIVGDEDQLPDGGDDVLRGAIALTAPSARQA